MFDIVIIGAGASGLVTAIVSARRGKKVLILEKNSKVGKKLLATGNGRCNITNQRPTHNRFYSQNPKFVTQLLNGYSYQSIKQFFKSIGLELIESKEGKVFPMSLQASSVVNLLQSECEQLGVKIRCDAHVKKIVNKKDEYLITYTTGHVNSLNIVIATGHKSAPALGGVDDGVLFAERFGHRVVESHPSLVQLTSSMPNLKRIAGVKVEGRVRCGSIERQGDVLFTSYGLSGLAILDISRDVIERLKKSKTIKLEIDLMPKMSREQLLSLMRKSLQKKSQKPLDIWMQGFINRKLILPILEPLKLEKQTVGSISSNINLLETIVSKIKAFEVVVDGSRGYKGAEVATGGVDTKEINPKTMESLNNRGLYFTGEVLDVDGDRGGFNLHFAWICGLRVGESI